MVSFPPPCEKDREEEGTEKKKRNTFADRRKEGKFFPLVPFGKFGGVGCSMRDKSSLTPPLRVHTSRDGNCCIAFLSLSLFCEDDGRARRWRSHESIKEDFFYF